eukprot:9189753-Ditylum_brightwellii.AAC.1
MDKMGNSFVDELLPAPGLTICDKPRENELGYTTKAGNLFRLAETKTREKEMQKTPILHCGD